MVACSIEIPLLAAVLPADFDGIEALEEQARLELEAAGASLTQEGESRAQLGPWRSLSGRPAVSVATVPDCPVSIAAIKLKRSLDIFRVLFELPLARRRLTRSGFPYLKTLRWSPSRTVESRGFGSSLRSISTRAYVTGSVIESYTTMLDRSLELASRAIGVELRLEKLVSADSLVAICDRGVLRLSLRPAKRQHLAYAGLERLEQRAPEPLRRLVPRPLAAGECGPYLWSLEERMNGTSARAPLSPSLTEQAFNVLFLLADSGEQTRAATGLIDEAGLLGAVTDRELGLRLEEAAHSLEERLAPLPRIAGHGDFWAGNLLADGDKLRGVVDWDSWNARELPLIDFLHLHLLHKRSLPWAKWGPALLALLLPYARSGGDERALAYCRKLGIEPDPELLEQLVWAYWIRRAARQTECFELRSSERCIDSAIRKVAPVFLEFMARRKTSGSGKHGS
jgi:hypothetical protein